MATVLRDKPLRFAAWRSYASGANRLCSRNWRQSRLKPAMTPVFIQRLRPVCMFHGNTLRPSPPYIDLFLADLKHVADGPFKQWTDGSAAGAGKFRKPLPPRAKMAIRVPLIQGFNADEETIVPHDFAADELHVGEIHFRSYHAGHHHFLPVSPIMPRINHWMRWRYLILPRSSSLRGLTATTRIINMTQLETGHAQ